MADPKKVRAEANALVQELLTRLDASDVRELEVTRGAIRVRVAKDAPQRATHAAATATAAPVPAAANGPSVVSAPAAADTGNAITAPLTGIFYRSPSPQAPAFVQIGSIVAAGDVIGLIEAMKLFNEIRSTKSGTVLRVLADNGQLVRAHQPLIELE
ncbi:MAG TPA: acetyl-CoA carboxylase biotin carboxyl carrier protein [Candidatus Limnocylindria bacterium]|nr:acetyl-CoA carboxylase biotin carboxyl carrier protein [Candidatus Limnocylindria bacterium]